MSSHGETRVSSIETSPVPDYYWYWCWGENKLQKQREGTSPLQGPWRIMPSDKGHYLKELELETGASSAMASLCLLKQRVFFVCLVTNWDDLNSWCNTTAFVKYFVSSISAWTIQAHFDVLYVLDRQWLSTSAMRMCHCCFLDLQSILLEVSNAVSTIPNKMFAVDECCWYYFLLRQKYPDTPQQICFKWHLWGKKEEDVHVVSEFY